MSNGIEYTTERLEDCLEEMKPLLQKHWEEIALYKDEIKLNPDYDKYFELQAMDALHIVTARDGDKLIGYFISMLDEHMHYQDHLYAVNDILYVEESKRGGDIAIGMFQYAEEKLKELGVSVLIVSMKTAKPFDALCEALGYDNVERTYSKFIKEN